MRVISYLAAFVLMKLLSRPMQFSVWDAVVIAVLALTLYSFPNKLPLNLAGTTKQAFTRSLVVAGFVFTAMYLTANAYIWSGLAIEPNGIRTIALTFALVLPLQLALNKELKSGVVVIECALLSLISGLYLQNSYLDFFEITTQSKPLFVLSLTLVHLILFAPMYFHIPKPTHLLIKKPATYTYYFIGAISAVCLIVGTCGLIYVEVMTRLSGVDQ